MNNCNFSFQSQEIESVKLFTDSELVFYVPLQLYRPILYPADWSLVNGQGNVPPTGITLLARPDTITFPEVGHGISAHGAKYTVKLEYLADRSDESDLSEQLQLLSSSFYHILITFTDGTQSVIRSTEDSFAFATEESDGQTKCTITITNTSGLQRLVAIN